MSAYYHYHPIEHPHPEKETSDKSAPIRGVADENALGQGVMRNPFVGILFAVGALLFAYQGCSRLEDYALNLAGIMAWGVALFPMKWPEGVKDSSFSLHGTFAILFFVCIAYVCIWRARDTLPLVEVAAIRMRYLRTYQFLGWAMVLFPFLAWALISLTPLHKSVIFFVELAGVYVFGTYWVIKSHEALKTAVDEKASRGDVRARPHGLSDVFSQLPANDETRSMTQTKFKWSKRERDL